MKRKLTVLITDFLSGATDSSRCDPLAFSANEQVPHAMRHSNVRQSHLQAGAAARKFGLIMPGRKRFPALSHTKP